MPDPSNLIVSPAVLREVANTIKTKASDIEAAALAAEQSITALREMQSKRVSKILEAWDELTKSLKANVESLIATADAQVTAADAFTSADEI